VLQQLDHTSRLHNNEGIVGVVGLFVTCEDETQAKCLSQILGDELCCIVTLNRKAKLAVQVEKRFVSDNVRNTTKFPHSQ